MKVRLVPSLLILALLFVSAANAQRTEISIGLSEQFFDTVVDALFQNGEPPEFSIAGSKRRVDEFMRDDQRTSISITYPSSFFPQESASACKESIRLSRELNGIRTAVRFREGKIYAPLAFRGSYNPPFVGCVDFSGWAETNIELRFDQESQRLVADAKVLNVILSGTGGVGSGLIARMVQNAIDRKINPIEVIRMDKVSFIVPIQNSGNLKMKAVGVRNEIQNGSLLIHIAYEFARL